MGHCLCLIMKVGSNMQCFMCEQMVTDGGRWGSDWWSCDARSLLILQSLISCLPSLTAVCTSANFRLLGGFFFAGEMPSAKVASQMDY